MTEIPKAYTPSEIEESLYAYWERHKLFRSEIDPSKKSYTIVIPPPNITGMLTMGHILNNTLQDILIRLKKMQGYNACWVPGTDHASIATENKVAKYLEEQGIDKKTIGRDEFLKHCAVWKEKYGGIIIRQLKKLGVSCDWERLRFTMDDHYYQKVIEGFVQLYRDGKIYRGYRMVNWDPATKSAISDEEVIFKTVQGKLWYIRYAVENSGDTVVIATTRPETMLGDTAIAVNPNDERYAHLIGKRAIVPIVNRFVPIIADEYVEQGFGTGALKVTPAHDVNDFVLGQKHHLEVINIFNPDATLNENAPKELIGLDRYDARKAVVKLLEETGKLEKVEEYQNNVGYSDRGNVPIEPYLSEQWFMKMDELAKPALEVVRNGAVRFHPAHWTKTYEHWMDGIRDWCISRQLWWGHRIPVWYHKDTNEMYCDTVPPNDIENWRQEEDVLDTWASSWLWAHDVFETKEEQDYYYPTNTLITAPDIIFFWVARMIMAGLYFKRDIPFKDVYFTSIIRDMQGRKMSKSLGNSPDPIDVIRDYGADALRFTVIYLAPLGQDVLFSTEKCDIGRNFANKIWNAGRFLLMNAETIAVNPALKEAGYDFVDAWIDSRINSTLLQLDTAFEKFEFNSASKIIYSFVWNDFCDWFIELSKPKLYGEDKDVQSGALTRALVLFEQLLKIVHPFMPFITEELWQRIDERKDGESIMTSDYPKYDVQRIDQAAEKKMELFQDVTVAIRNIRGEMNIPPSRGISVFMKTDLLDTRYSEALRKMVKADDVVFDPNLSKPAKSASAVVRDIEIFIPLEGIIDLDIERKRLEKEIQRLEGGIAGIDKKLLNASFVDRAPADVIQKERQKKADWESNLAKLKEIHGQLQ